MIEEDRPSPEEFLSAVKEEEIRKGTGKLKIFFGMSAGVGKTYAMLEDAQQKVREGEDLAVGVIETHGRQETARLLEGLKIIPMKKILYKDSFFEEMDLDEILRRKPSLAIVDELAHSNVPGSRHPKRWQDVIELLDAGIDVYTTLNVQHVESRKEFVESIAGINIQETVPDLILERAPQIELIDITPAELRKRLKEGKVYLGPQSELAAQNFFTESKLTALREIALRFTAEKVDHDLHGMAITGELKKWRFTEKLMVAVSHSPHSQYLIRSTRRRAFKLDSPWIAVHVDNGSSLTEEEMITLAKNLTLARDLGAEVITTVDPDIIKALERIIKNKNVTQMVVGRSPRSAIVEYLFGRTLVDRLIREITDIDIQIVRKPHLMGGKKPRNLLTFTSKFSSYLIILALIGLITCGNLLVVSYIGPKTIGFTYLLAILIFSVFFGKGPTLFSAVLSTAVWNTVFLIDSSMPYDWNDIAFVVLYFLTAMITGMFTSRIKEREQLLQKREEKTQAIYEIVREIASAPSTQHALQAVATRLGKLLNGTSEIIVKELNGELILNDKVSIYNDEKEKALAIWVFEHGKEAGWSTETLSSVKHLYVPLKGFSEIMGVLLFCSLKPQTPLSIEESNLLHTTAQQLAYYLEKCFAEEQARHVHYLRKIEKLHETLFSSISDEFRSPLISIKQAVEYLKKEKSLMNVHEGVKSINAIEASSDNLTHFVENILMMAQLGTGFFSPHLESHDVHELVSACVSNLEKALKDHHLKIDISPDLPLISFDFALMEILLCNLLLNAIAYSPKGTTIEVEAKASDRFFRLAVKDEGQGIPQDFIPLIFEKFYRVPGSPKEGIGLGLPIAKAIAELHHGKLEVKNRETKGAEFYLQMPLLNNA
jgi:two-component system, OmpR family, sensor histidine kinase KdpD